MKKILYALTGVSMLALTTQVSAMTVKQTNQWASESGGYHDNEHSRTFDVDDHQVGSDTFQNEREWQSRDHGEEKSTGDIPNDPFVGPGGEPPVGDGAVVVYRGVEGGPGYPEAMVD